MSEFFDLLVTSLTSPDRLVQARAAQLLGALGDEAAIEPLINYVSNCRYHCKTAGFTALAELMEGDEPQMETICELVDAPNCEDEWYWIGCKSVRAAASVALLSLGEAYGERYLSELADSGDDVFYAWFAPAVLSLEGDLDDIDRLQGYLTVKSILKPDKKAGRLTEPGTLSMALEAVGMLGSDKALFELRNYLEFRSRYVRGAAVLALAKADPDAPSEAAISQMAAEAATDFERVRATQAMCVIGRENYLSRLCEMAKTIEGELERYTAMSALAEVDAELAIDPDAANAVFMSGLGDSSPWVRSAAIDALDACGGCDDLDPVIALYKNDSDLYVRMQAAAMLALRS